MIAYGFQQNHGTCGCARNAQNGEQDRLGDRNGNTGYGDQTTEAECKIDEFCHKNTDHISVYTDFGNEKPNEKYTHGCVYDIIKHGVQLLLSPRL